MKSEGIQKTQTTESKVSMGSEKDEADLAARHNAFMARHPGLGEFLQEEAEVHFGTFFQSEADALVDITPSASGEVADESGNVPVADPPPVSDPDKSKEGKASQVLGSRPINGDETYWDPW